MLVSKNFIRVNKSAVAIVLFVALFSLIHFVKPGLLYTKDGAFREFGVGYRQKTVVPIWGIAIILAIVSYLGVLAFLRFA
jgi:amino acid permease